MKCSAIEREIEIKKIKNKKSLELFSNYKLIFFCSSIFLLRTNEQ